MPPSAEAVLLGDVGATNARFGMLVEGVLGPIKWIEVARHPATPSNTSCNCTLTIIESPTHCSPSLDR